MRKKIVSIALVVLMIAAMLAACTPQSPSVTPPENNTETNTPVPQDNTSAPQDNTPEPQPNDTPSVPDAPVEEEYVLPKEAGMNQITFYWTMDDVNWDKADMWIWFPGKDGRGYEFHKTEYGGKVMLNIPTDVTEVGFIVRYNCSMPGGASWGDATKDGDADRFAEITGSDTVIYLKYGDSMQYTSKDGGKTLDPIKSFTLAGITAMNTIKYVIAPAHKFESLDEIAVTDMDGNKLEIASVSSLGNNVIMGEIVTAEPLELTKLYTVTLEDYGSLTAVPTGIFDSAEFIENYTYDGELGALQVDGEHWEFRLWAPTSMEVLINIYEAGNGGSAILTQPMELGEKGVWSAIVPCTAGMYYTYTVTNALGTFEVVDPYARSVGVNGNRGMLVDPALRADSVLSAEWSHTKYYDGIEGYEDAVIWEVHVRDFSNTIESSEYQGKYLAFTETGLVNEAGVPIGLDYLKELGVTHIHLQPIYDYATVDESKLDTAQFNWGYDPKNYNAPEGSYSTDPYDGYSRVAELKALVDAIHNAGMGVIMDVVYNHTYSLDSNFTQIVPYYYYRYNAKGEASNGSGCGNETASDRAMFRKFMVDSISYWQDEYHIDGFRFDLMALHDIETIQQVEAAVHAENPKAIIYGEGWTGGTSALNSNLQATQANISKVKASEGAIGSVAVFNDAIRDGLKGSVFDQKGKGYISGEITKATANSVLFGIMGGKRGVGASWGVENNMVINYMSSHDNNTLWDKLLYSNPDDSDETRFAMNKFGANIVFISNGTPFILAGEEMLRSKDGDENSYNSSDEVNNIDWEVLVPGSPEFEMMLFYKSLIEFRKGHDYLRNSDVEGKVLDDNSLEVRYSVDGVLKAIAIINPHESGIAYTLDGDYSLVWSGGEAEGDASGMITVPGRTVVIVEPK